MSSQSTTHTRTVCVHCTSVSAYSRKWRPGEVNTHSAVAREWIKISCCDGSGGSGGGSGGGGGGGGGLLVGSITVTAE